MREDKKGQSRVEFANSSPLRGRSQRISFKAGKSYRRSIVAHLTPQR